MTNALIQICWGILNKQLFIILANRSAKLPDSPLTLASGRHSLFLYPIAFGLSLEWQDSTSDRFFLSVSCLQHFIPRPVVSGQSMQNRLIRSMHNWHLRLILGSIFLRSSSLYSSSKSQMKTNKNPMKKVNRYSLFLAFD